MDFSKIAMEKMSNLVENTKTILVNQKYGATQANNEFENAQYKHVWGVMASDDNTGMDCCLWTHNDLHIVYCKDNDHYELRIENNYKFLSPEHEKQFLNRLLSEFTTYMTGNGYTTSYDLPFSLIFDPDGIPPASFPNLESVYAWFKFAVAGSNNRRGVL